MKNISFLLPAMLLLCAGCGADAEGGCETQYTVLLHNLPGGAQQQKVCAGDTLRPEVPPQAGVSFVGWYADRDFKQRVGAIAPTGNMALYARYIAAFEVNVSDIPRCIPNLVVDDDVYIAPTFFMAYEDEPGTYSSHQEAEAACQSKGLGWHLPSVCEIIYTASLSAASNSPFKPIVPGVNYWGAEEAYQGASTPSYSGRYRVRCAWRVWQRPD
jgi:hypothetical protein